MGHDVVQFARDPEPRNRAAATSPGIRTNPPPVPKGPKAAVATISETIVTTERPIAVAVGTAMATAYSANIGLSTAAPFMYPRQV